MIRHWLGIDSCAPDRARLATQMEAEHKAVRRVEAAAAHVSAEADLFDKSMHRTTRAIRDAAGIFSGARH